MRSKPLSKIQKILNKLSQNQSTLQRSPHLIGYKSPDCTSQIKKFINLCNSLSIVFSYHRLFNYSLEVLKKALKSDVVLFFQGSKTEKIWPGRALVYCNLSYLLLKTEDFSGSLKFLYDSENLLRDVAEPCDLHLASPVLGFLAMCKIGETAHALDYLEHSTEQFNKIIKEEVITKYSEKTCMNLYCIFSLAGAFLNGSTEKVLEGFSQIEAYDVLKRIVMRCDDGFQVLCDEEFQEFVFLTVFFPFITWGTPVIALEEIVKEKKLRGGSGKVRENYESLMRSALE